MTTDDHIAIYMMAQSGLESDLIADALGLSRVEVKRLLARITPGPARCVAAPKITHTTRTLVAPSKTLGRCPHAGKASE